jgi:hypothetical protein
MDSENNNFKAININFDKKNKSNSKKTKNLIIYLLCFIFLIFLAYILFFKNNIIIINKNNIKELINISKMYMNNQNKMLKNNILSNYKYNYHRDNIPDKLKMLRLFTNNNYIKYKGVEKCLLYESDNQLCIYHLIAPKKVIGKERILIGEKRDGCYVLLNDFKDIRIAYSFGISKLIQFDQGLAERGIDVYMYDHIINSLPYYNPKFHWEKIGISGKKNENNTLKTLEHLLEKNGHRSEKNMILKIDVENSEWESLKDVSEDVLKQFKYIVIEFHFYTNNVELYHNIIQKLYKNHQVFYLRCHGREVIVKFGNNIICKCLEASYVIREGNLFDKDDSIYPIFEFDFMGPKATANLEMNLNILKLFYN